MKKRQRIMDQQLALKAAKAASAAGSAAAAVTPLLMGVDLIPLQSFTASRVPQVKNDPLKEENYVEDGEEAEAMIHSSRHHFD